MVCDEKRGTLRRKEGDANEKQALKGRMNRLRGRPKRRWLDKVKDGLKENKRLSADDVYDSATWRRMSSYKSTPHKSGNKMKEKKKEEW